jgi:MFS family permease
MRRPTSWLNRNVLAMGLTDLSSDASHEMATAILPAFLTGLVGATAAPQLLGIISGASDAASSLVKTFSGWASDRLGRRKPPILLGYFLVGIFVGLIGMARNWGEILIYRVLAWVGRGTRDPPRDALLAESVAKRYYGRTFGFNRAMDTVGAVMGPLLAFFLIQSITLRNIFFISFIPGLLAFLIVAVGVREGVRKRRGGWGLVRGIGRLPGQFKTFLLIMFIFGIGNFHRTLLLLRVYETLTPVSGAIVAGSMAALLLAIRNVVQALADYGVGALSDRVGKKILLALLGFFLFGITCVGFVYAADNLLYFIGLFALSGVSAASYTALERAYAADLLPPGVRGTGYGVLYTIDGLGDFISGSVAGTLWAVISPTATFLYGACVSFIATFLLLGTGKR